MIARKDIERWFEEVEANDRAEDELYGKESGWELPPEPADTQKRREFIGKFMKELEDRKKAGNAGSEGPTKDKEQAYPPREKSKPAVPENQTRLVFPDPPKGEGPTPEREKGKEPAKPKDKDRINFTDPDSRIMRNSDKAFLQGYNAQAAVDAETHHWKLPEGTLGRRRLLQRGQPQAGRGPGDRSLHPAREAEPLRVARPDSAPRAHPRERHPEGQDEAQAQDQARQGSLQPAANLGGAGLRPHQGAHGLQASPPPRTRQGAVDVAASVRGVQLDEAL